MKRKATILSLLSLSSLLPAILHAQSSTVQDIHTVLESTKEQLLPLGTQLIDVATAVAGFGALFYIGYRVWKHIAAAEPIDFFPLFRPFALTLLIGLYNTLVLPVMDGVLNPITLKTQSLFNKSNQAVEDLLLTRAIQINRAAEGTPVGNPTNGNRNYDKYEKPEPTTSTQQTPTFSFGAKLMRNSMSFMFKLMLSTVLQIVYYAASIIIDVMRTFILLLLGILGPFVLAFSIYDGFQHTLSVWIGRYINVYLWLPIANIFGTIINMIQKNMLQLDMAQIQANGSVSFSETDASYLIFLLISIVGYFSIPGVANYVIHASGGHSIMSTVGMFSKTSMRLLSGGTAGGGSSKGGSSGGSGGGSMANDTPGDDKKMGDMANAANSDTQTNDSNSHQAGKLS
ncbi:Bacteroides conjugative transposon TraJ protein [Filimonas lacunae]|uniref:Bacteroides conjugative transposon TraJ protein n=1 Tax=Filimonas lacunae TaxID=477680 RepID=A0A173MAA1_9BACT|nr:conjugative transposon protein TraJ [Filimonas lacunae]BAV04439.1 conjugative transposon protein TraJ [Filimonas lacunae]SIT31447.1 Bacteroides conjugative transposon TraJ protein [Filimonas lacunae]